MNYLGDSDWVAAYLKGRPDAVTLLGGLDGRAISLITFGEIYEGIYYGADPKASEAGFRRFLRGVVVPPWVPTAQVSLDGKPGDDAKRYQERQVRQTLAEVERRLAEQQKQEKQ